jgi:sulfoxide reductase heme-binding subunit YedZ
MRPGSREFYRWTKLPLWLLGLAPLAWMVLGVFGLWGVSLGANPVEKLLDEAGLWSLRILLLTLAITPLRILTGRTWLLGYRRLLGLFAFFYLVLHLTIYLVLDRTLDLGLILEDVVERPFITLGVLAFLAMVPLAVTSTRGWMRRLGKRWQKLHRLVYGIAILGVWHYYWQVKLDTVEPTIYAVILTVLLAFRIRETWKRRQRQRARTARKAGAYSPTETASSS